MKLVWPSAEYLPAYIAALEQGWSADNVRGKVAADEELDQIAADSAAFLASLVDREANGEPVTLPDGSQVARLPGYPGGSGMVSSVVPLASAGKLAQKLCRRTALVMLDTRLYLGSNGAATRRAHCASSCPRLGQRD